MAGAEKFAGKKERFRHWMRKKDRNTAVVTGREGLIRRTGKVRGNSMD